MRKLSARVKELYQKSIKEWPQLRGWEQPALSLDLRDTRAGLALYFENKIQFNLVYYFHYPKRFLEETVGHEIAHLVDYQLNGFEVINDHHGKSWQNIMWCFGLIPNRLHPYDMNLLKKSEKRS